MNGCEIMTEKEEKLVLDNQKLIGLVINNNHLKFRFNELVDVGMIGLIKGVKSFDDTKGIKLSTFLCHCIQSEIYIYLRKSQTQKRGRDYKTISLEQEICIGDRNVYISDVIADDKVNIEEEVIRKEELETIYKVIEELSEKEQYILNHTFELKGAKKMTGEEIAKVLNVTQPTVNRTLHRIISKIKKSMKNTFYKY